MADRMTIMCDIGELHVKTGPMFCGKSTELIRELTTESVVNDPTEVLYINSDKDTRVTISQCEGVTTHNPVFSGNINFDTIKVGDLSNVDVSKYRVIGVDEIQFFENILPTILNWKNSGKIVYVVGLDGDASCKPFGEVSTLLPISETFVKMSARCKTCAGEGKRNVIAPFTVCNVVRHSHFQPGAGEMYSPACWKHTK